MTQKELKPQIVENFEALYLPQCHKGAMGNFKRSILHCMLQPHNALQWQGRKSHPSVAANFPFCPLVGAGHFTHVGGGHKEIRELADFVRLDTAQTKIRAA